jgi:pyridoxamine 5'-phosphate oxidase
MNTHEADILATVWRTLSRGSVDPKHDWHWPALATVDSDAWPQVRTVVLRKVDSALRQLEVHSDSRAQKIEQLQSGRASLHFYDRKSRTQIRMLCLATVHIDNPIAQLAWDRLSDHTREQYLSFSEKFFAVIHLTAIDIDWLWLDRHGHQRNRFNWQNNAWRCSPLQP